MNDETPRGSGTRRRVWVVAVAALSVLAALTAVAVAARATAAPPSPTTAQVVPLVTPSCRAGTGPYYPAYDPVNHDLYVPNLNSANLTVFNGSCHKVGTVTLPAGSGPVAAAFNPVNNRVYVTDDNHNQVYMVLGTSVVKTITSTYFVSPFHILYDPGDRVMLVANDNSNDVVVISGSVATGTIPVGNWPGGMCYDPYYSSVLVVNFLSRNVTVLNAVYPFSSKLANTPVGFDPEACAFDVASGYDYVTNLGDDNVTAMLGDGGFVGTINVGSQPSAIAWDQSTLRIYVVNTGSKNISVISGLSVVNTINKAIPSQEGLVYDEFNDHMYVVSFSTDRMYQVA